MALMESWEELRSKGLQLMKEKDVDEAIGILQQATEKSRELEDHKMTCISLGELGIAFSRKGNFREAMVVNEQALVIARREKMQYSEAALLTNIGRNYHQQGMIEMALSYYERAMPIFDDIGNKQGKAKALYFFGTASMDIGRKSKALDCFIHSVFNFHEIGDTYQESLVISAIVKSQGEDVEAMRARISHCDGEELCW